MPGMLRGRAMSLPKKTMHKCDELSGIDSVLVENQPVGKKVD
jgi:hypothetical protein